MLRIQALGCALLALLAAAKSALQEAAPTESQDAAPKAREASSPPREVLREEFFVLELGDSPAKIAGYAAWRRRIVESVEGRGEQVEWDLWFRGPDGHAEPT